MKAAHEYAPTPDPRLMTFFYDSIRRGVEVSRYRHARATLTLKAAQVSLRLFQMENVSTVPCVRNGEKVGNGD